jgi:hypothetical protein
LILRALLVLALVASAGCGKSTAPSALLPSGSASDAGSVDAAVAASPADDGAVGPMDAREAAQWAAAGASDADADELARLAELVGCEGLHERAGQAGLRMTALRAAQFCHDFSELPWLAQVGTAGSDDEARLALDAVVELAARPRRATDPEDADELHVGCLALLELARAPDRPKERRVLAIRSLRMLSDRGCVRRADIPTDLDAR